MPNEQLMRDYRMTDSELTVFTQHICDSMTRDISEFAAYGVLEANVDFHYVQRGGHLNLIQR